MALLNNADEPEMNVTTPDVAGAGTSWKQKIAALIADLPNRFPPLEKSNGDDRRSLEDRRKANLEGRFKEWVGREAARRCAGRC